MKNENGVTSPVRLTGIATAVPAFKLDQADIMARAAQILPGVDETALTKMLPIYESTGVKTRYSCVPAEWYENSHSWEDKNRLYMEHAVDLLEQVTKCVAEKADIPLSDIDAIVAVSSTGIATPSLDAHLIERLPFRRNVERSPLFGLGCAGGVIGLSRAATIARSDPAKTVLLLVVELCGLTFRRDDSSKANIVATALFGDGAAALLLSCSENGPAFEFGGEYSWPQSLDVMGWKVEDDGLGVVFSRDIPTLTRNEFKRVASEFLRSHELTYDDVDQFACHPGGAKVLEALEEAFDLPFGSLVTSRDILRDYGNMSATTVLFVLERLLAQNKQGRFLLSSLGPGFTAAFQTMNV